MGLRTQTNKASLSSWMLIIFIFALVLSAGISEFFQAPKALNQELQQYHFLFSRDQIANFDEIEIHNRLGNFTIKRSTSKESAEGSWKMISPRLLPASKGLVERLLLTLEGVKIRKLYPKDPINLSNFSLDNPLMKFNLKTTDGTEEEIHFGLVNPIDNSTYIYSSSKEVIYHVDALANSLEGQGLSDFVDSKVFTMNLSTIKEMNLFRGENSLQLSLRRENDQWMGKGEKVLQPDEVAEYMNGLLDVRSALILDKLTDSLQTTLERLMATPFYSVEIKETTGRTVTYRISTIVNNIPDVKIDKGQIFIIKASNRDHPYVLTKDSFRHFGKKHTSFKKLPFKKLFY